MHRLWHSISSSSCKWRPMRGQIIKHFMNTNICPRINCNWLKFSHKKFQQGNGAQCFDEDLDYPHQLAAMVSGKEERLIGVSHSTSSSRCKWHPMQVQIIKHFMNTNVCPRINCNSVIKNSNKKMAPNVLTKI